MDYSLLCRCCVKEFSQDELNFSNECTMDMYLFCIQVREEDILPKTFCSNCCYQIHLTYTFIKDAQAKNKKLQDRIYQSKGIKNDNFHSENYSFEYDNKSEVKFNYVDLNENSSLNDAEECKSIIGDSQTETNEMRNRENHDCKQRKNFKRKKLDKQGKVKTAIDTGFKKEIINKIKKQSKLKIHDTEDVQNINDYTEEEITQDQSEIRSTEVEPMNNDDKNSTEQYNNKTGNSHLPETITNENNTTCKTSKTRKYPSHEITKSDKKLACPVCDKIYSQYRFLEIHFTKKHSNHTNTMLRHNNKCGEEKPFVCNACEKRFRLRKGLAAHALTHSNETPFICDCCHMSFKMKQILLKHMRTHKQDYPYLCHICAKGFKTEHNLREHMPKHTGDKSYACAQCSYRSAYRSSLRRHEVRHAAAPAHVCEHCQKAFYERAALNRHTRIHTGQKPFKCPRCPLAFIDHWKRKTHLMRVHQVPFAEIPRLAADGQPIAQW